MKKIIHLLLGSLIIIALFINHNINTFNITTFAAKTPVCLNDPTQYCPPQYTQDCICELPPASDKPPHSVNLKCWDTGCDTEPCPGGQECFNNRCVNPNCPTNPTCTCDVTPSTSQCDYIKIYNPEGEEISFDEIQPITIYTFSTNGPAAEAGRFRFNANGGEGFWNTTDVKDARGNFSIVQAFAAGDTYTIEAQTKAYDIWWSGPMCNIGFGTEVTKNLVCNSLTRTPTRNLNIGDLVLFGCTGTSTNITINHYEFQISSDNGSNYTILDRNNLTGSIGYNIPSAGNYVAQCRVCTSADSAKCTTWGQAGGWTP